MAASGSKGFGPIPMTLQLQQFPTHTRGVTNEVADDMIASPITAELMIDHVSLTTDETPLINEVMEVKLRLSI